MQIKSTNTPRLIEPNADATVINDSIAANSIGHFQENPSDEATEFIRLGHICEIKTNTMSSKIRTRLAT